MIFSSKLIWRGQEQKKLEVGHQVVKIVRFNLGGLCMPTYCRHIFAYKARVQNLSLSCRFTGISWMHEPWLLFWKGHGSRSHKQKMDKTFRHFRTLEWCHCTNPQAILQLALPFRIKTAYKKKFCFVFCISSCHVYSSICPHVLVESSALCIMQNTPSATWTFSVGCHL